MEAPKSPRSSCRSGSCLSLSKQKESEGDCSSVIQAGSEDIRRSSAPIAAHEILADTAPAMLCACLWPAASFIANTPNNPNMEFLRCGNPARQHVRCDCYRGIQGCFLWIWKDLLDKYAYEKVAVETRHLEVEKRAAAVAAEAKEAGLIEEMARMQLEMNEARSKVLSLEKSNEGLEELLRASEGTSRKRKVMIVCLVVLLIARIVCPVQIVGGGNELI